MRIRENSESEFAFIPEAARRVGLGEKLVRHLIHEDEIPVYRTGKKWVRIRVADLVAWVESTRVDPRRDAELRLAEIER